MNNAILLLLLVVPMCLCMCVYVCLNGRVSNMYSIVYVCEQHVQ